MALGKLLIEAADKQTGVKALDAEKPKRPNFSENWHATISFEHNEITHGQNIMFVKNGEM